MSKSEDTKAVLCRIREDLYQLLATSHEEYGKASPTALATTLLEACLTEIAAGRNPLNSMLPRAADGFGAGIFPEAQSTKAKIEAPSKSEPEELAKVMTQLKELGSSLKAVEEQLPGITQLSVVALRSANCPEAFIEEVCNKYAPVFSYVPADEREQNEEQNKKKGWFARKD